MHRQARQTSGASLPLRFSSLIFALLLLLLADAATASPLPAPQLAGAGQLQQDNGQVTINQPKDGNGGANGTLPITATVFHGVPGPKDCRGGAMSALQFAAGTGATEHSEELCYDLADTAGCGNFVADKAEGCQARLFAEVGCKMYVNTAVFQPEARAVGGQWRSMAIRCGVPEPDPASLGAPPLAGMITKQTSKKKGG